MRKIDVVAAVVIEGNKVLAMQRGYGKFAGLWEFPGGKTEVGETGEQALTREMREEMEIEVEVGELMKTIEHQYPDFELTMRCYKTRIVSGEIKLLEHKALKWVGAEDILDLEWLPADLGFVEELKEYLAKL